MESADNPPPLDYRKPATVPGQPEIPHRAATLGMALFLASLAMLFLASLLGYILMRTTSRLSPPWGALPVPVGLYLSTLIVVLGSVTVHMAVSSVRQERQDELRRWLLASLLLSIAFVLVQAIFLRQLLGEHHAAQARNVQLYGLIFFLVLLHGLHVMGGVIALFIVYRQAALGMYDHEKYIGVRHAAAYWHFLDAVWLTMFALFLILK